ncbi:hypothetical protein [Weizmannia acidilactici]|uniref:hypothetical protein n=1 Tax=Weizmannia acidilactici TaxID=2607726 RepID=UPI00124ED38E|nr:hypothetical protein [Weizmannia acidilactici]
MVILFPVFAGVVLFLFCCRTAKKEKLKTMGLYLWLYCWTVNILRIMELNLRWIHDRHIPIIFISRQLILFQFPFLFLLYLHFWHRTKFPALKSGTTAAFFPVFAAYLAVLQFSGVLFAREWSWRYLFVFFFFGLAAAHTGDVLFKLFGKKGAAQNAS